MCDPHGTWKRIGHKAHISLLDFFFLFFPKEDFCQPALCKLSYVELRDGCKSLCEIPVAFVAFAWLKRIRYHNYVLHRVFSARHFRCNEMLISSSNAAAIFYFKIYVSEDLNSMRNRTIFYSCPKCAAALLTSLECSHWHSTRPSRVVISNSIFGNGYVMCICCTIASDKYHHFGFGEHSFWRLDNDLWPLNAYTPNDK